MRAIIFIWSLVALVIASELSSDAAEWYESLRPGVTRSEILKLAGNPSGSDGKVDTYAQVVGRIQCAYEGSILRSAIYYDGPGGAVSSPLYKMDGELTDSDLALRKNYLKTGDFKVMPEFSGRKVYTHKYPGTCYEVDGGFIVAEPIIDLGGGMGFFEDKAARVLWLKPDGAEMVLYRAADHWATLKPTGLLERDIKNRKIKLREAGDRLPTMGVTNTLGESDSVMGSGVLYRLYYLENGLAVVTCVAPNGTFEHISIWRPGLTNLTLSEWLNDRRPDASTNVDLPLR